MTSEDWKEKASSWGRYSTGFLRFVGRRFLDDQCLLWAGMLCYASLLAVVPLLGITFGVVSSFPVFEQWSQSLHGFIFENFVPATGEVIQQHIDRFVAKATELSAVGTLGLILSAILLMVNMERALNAIWRVGRPRSPGSRFVVYWAVLTVGPLLLGASLAISSYVISLPLVAQAASTLGLRGLLLSIAPVAFSALAFTLIFIIVPNVAVPWRYAAAGGFLAAVLFEVAKQGFAIYVTNFPAYETIYGAFAAFPLFLVWVYLSWTIILMGASFGSALGRYRVAGSQTPWPRNLELILVVRLVHHLWRAQKAGRGLELSELLEREPRAGHDQTERLVEQLENHHLVKVADDGSWLLSKDLDDVTLADLLRLDLPLPVDASEETSADGDVSFQEALYELATSLEPQLGRTLAELFETESTK